MTSSTIKSCTPSNKQPRLALRSTFGNSPAGYTPWRPSPWAPAVTTALRGDQLALSVRALGQSGRQLAAQVPLRIRLYNAETQALEIYRGTSRQGSYEDTLSAAMGTWTLEVTEMLGGHTTTGTIAVTAPLPKLITARPDVETFRRGQLTQLLAAAQAGGLTLALPAHGLLTDQQVAALSAALKARGIALGTDKPLPSDPKAGIYLTAGYAGKTMGVLLDNARNAGLAPLLISPNVPGPGRGFITPLYAPRRYGENVIALVGGDAAGLTKTVHAFCAVGQAEAVPLPPPAPAATGTPLHCRPAAAVAALPKLADMVGPRLSRIATCRNSPYLAVAASGFGKNLALIKDLGATGQVVSAQRVGASPVNDSLHLSPDGRYIGLSARELDRCGEAFHLLDVQAQTQTIFPAFGDLAARYHHFAASGDGKYVMAMGTYGVVCWQREAPRGRKRGPRNTGNRSTS